LSLPGVSASVGEMIAALERIGGQEVVCLIREEPDELVQKVVMGWPKRFNPVLAEKLGFRAETSFDAIIRAYLDDDFAK
ncbi:MAG: NAD-dependent epimerase, partial [Rhizobiales bacterium]|nr:NAD-dependent epimerase [Hyphomicrobiales bacterium]